MRSMPPTLITAVSATTQQMAISIQVQDLTTSFTTLVTSSLPGHVSSVISSDGAIVRAVIAGPAAGAIQVNTITSAGTSAQWQATPVTAASGARFVSGCALAAATGLVRLFYIRDTDSAICYVDSTNDGVSWSAEQVAAAAPAGIPYCRGICAPSPYQVLASFATYDTALAAAAIIYGTSQSGSWSALANSGPIDTAWGQIRGMAATTASAPIVVAGFMRLTLVTGFAAGSYLITGGKAGSWNTIQPMDPPSTGLSLEYPSVFWSGTYFYAAITLTDDGSISGAAQSRTAIWRSTDGQNWAIVANLGNLFPNGASVLVVNGTFYVFDGQTVMQAQTPPGALDLTPDLVTLEIVEKPNAESAATLTLSNYAGQYTGALQLKSNATVTIQLGYGPDLITTHVLYIDQVRYEAVADRLDVIVDLRDCAKFLTQVSNRFVALSQKTIAQLIQYVCDQAGVVVAGIGSTPQFSQIIPCFVITPGETWDTALNRLANVYSFSYRRQSSSVLFSERQPGDSSVWTYASETFGINWSKSADQSSVIRVIGAPTGNTVAFAEAIDTAQLSATGRERYRHIVERLLTTSAQCQIKAGLAMREEQSRATTGSLTVALNPGLELLDVVSITDPRVGLSNQQARIDELHWHIDMNTGAHYQQLALTLP